MGWPKGRISTRAELQKNEVKHLIRIASHRIARTFRNDKGRTEALA